MQLVGLELIGRQMVASHKKMLCNALVPNPTPRKEGKPRASQGKTVAVPEPVHERFSAFCSKRRIDIKGSVGQVLTWLMDQPAAVQSAVLGIEDGMQASYAEVIERIARDLRAEAGATEPDDGLDVEGEIRRRRP